MKSTVVLYMDSLGKTVNHKIRERLFNGSIFSRNAVLVFPINDSEQFQPQEEYYFIVTAAMDHSLLKLRELLLF